MTRYRSKETISAVQFTGTHIPDVTCAGSSTDKDTRDAARYAAGCDSSRAHHLHVHTQAIGGMTVLKPSDWIFPVSGGPWGTASDEKFRGHWEVPEAEAVPVFGSDGVVYGKQYASDGSLVGTIAAAPAAKTLDELLAEAGLPSAEEIKAVMDDEAAGKVKTPDTPEGVAVLTLGEEFQKVIGSGSMIVPDAPIDHLEV